VVVTKSSNKTTPTIGTREFFLKGARMGDIGVTSVIELYGYIRGMIIVYCGGVANLPKG
jgi:hypothetical protein